MSKAGNYERYRLSVGIGLIAMSTMILELMLTRVFDVLLVPNMAYFVVTSAVFAFGIAGIYTAIRPPPVADRLPSFLFRCSLAFACFTALLIPLINALPLDYTRIIRHPVVTVLAFGALYAGLVVPFFLGGIVVVSVFSRHPSGIQRLYFWDLAGAAAGSVLVMPLVESIGPGGLILLAAALAFVAACNFAQATSQRLIGTCGVVLVAAWVVVTLPNYVDFVPHMDKRGVLTALVEGRDEFARWSPMSKIDVIDQTLTSEMAQRSPQEKSWDRKAIQYDAGNQTSYFYRFDGNLAALRAQLDRDKSRVNEQFWQIGVLPSHYLKRDSGQSVLILGSAGGQETKAALVYGAARVDAVELVPLVVQLGLGQYSGYIGDIFHNPAVHVQAGEGRSFIRHSQRKYDIIQIYSNHTNSSIAQGTGALSPVYLQTKEAYAEYFTHLSANGVLHVNHHIYPRMITTAALAWKSLGRTDFRRHVAVFESPTELTLPTMLIKMQPWTEAEIAELSAFVGGTDLDPGSRLTLVENPLDASRSFLSDEFYSGEFPESMVDLVPVRVSPRTDDKPYFGELRKTVNLLQPDPARFLDKGSAYYVNLMLVSGVPMDWIHLISTGIVSVIFIVLFVLLPLRWSDVGSTASTLALPLVGYFSCLGAGFIILELVFIQKFTHLIGSPLHTYSTVIASMLAGAGLGSAMSERAGIGVRHSWAIPFIGILVCGTGLIALYPYLSHLFLGLPLPGRIAASALMLFPLAFFLGMPFPLGILKLSGQHPGLIAWAWGMNGLFTLVGGFAGMLVSMAVGFTATVFLALGLYLCACALFGRLHGLPAAGRSAQLTEASAARRS